MGRPHTLQRLQRAIGLFRQERYAEVLTDLAGLDDAESGNSVLALRQASRGSLLASEGHPEQAMELMVSALEHGAHIAAITERLAYFFHEHQRPMLAHHAFLLTDTLAPGSMQRFMSGLAEADAALYAPWNLRYSQDAQQDNPYLDVRYKRALVDRLGPRGAALTLAGMLTPPGQGVARLRRMTPLLEHIREHGSDLRMLVEAGPTPSTATRCFEGEPGPQPERTMRSIYTAALDDVVVASKSSFLLSGDTLLHDVQPDELELREVDLRVDPMIVSGSHELLTIVEHRNRDHLRHIPRAMTLCGTHSQAFGHWVMEFLPRVWALMDVPGFDDLPILIDRKMPHQHLGALRFFVGDDHPVIMLDPGERVLVERLFVSSAPVHFEIGPIAKDPNRIFPGIDDEGFGALMDRIRPRLRTVDRDGGPRRVYLARKKTQHRYLTNTEEVEALLEARGFERFDFADIAFDEQLRLVRGATDIVAAGGSAALMGMFAEPGLRLAIMNPPTFGDIGWITQASRGLGIDLMAIVGEITERHPRHSWMSDYWIDIDRLGRYLDHIDSI